MELTLKRRWASWRTRLGLALVAALGASGACGQQLTASFDSVPTLSSQGWVLTNNSSTAGPVGWFQGNSAVFSAQTGAANSYLAANFNAATLGANISLWAISPTLTTLRNGDVLTFYSRTESNSPAADRLEVRLSTNGASSNVGATDTSVGDFTTLLLEINPSATIPGYPNVWTKYTATLGGLPSGYNTGRIGWRYLGTGTSTAGNYIGIDTLDLVGQPTVSPDTTALTFSAQNVGSTSAAQTVTVTNSGTAVLNISSITASGDYARTTTCGATLAAGANCTIGVTFTPTAAGARSGSVVIASDAASSPDTISLSGTGVAVPGVLLSQTSLTFAARAVGTTSAAQTVALSNTGGAALTFTSINATGDFAVTHTCGSSLAAGGACNLNVTFTPTVAGARAGSIAIGSNAANSPHSVGLTGTGIAPNAPVCTLAAAPATVSKNGPSLLTSSCTNSPTSYAWTGGTCAGTTAATCAVTPSQTTTYSITATNGVGSGSASATVTVVSGDITPILFLLLFD